MLPTFWRDQYQLLLDYFREMQNLLNSEVIAIDEVEICFEKLKSHFYNHIIPLEADDIDLTNGGQWQSLQTELYRTMRLWETDMLFWQSSRNQTTRQSRLKMIGDRLNIMIRFCQEILKI